jgi:hypothetical protein
LSRLRLLVWLALAGGVLLLAGALYFDQAQLVVYDAKADRVLLSKRVRAGDSFTLSYLHSVAKSRVSGRFEVGAKRGIVARETSFGSFGPGLPEVKPGDPYRIEDGVIRLAVDQVVEELSFFVHPYTEHVLEIGAVRLELSKNLPAGSLVKVGLECARFCWSLAGRTRER